MRVCLCLSRASLLLGGWLVSGRIDGPHTHTTEIMDDDDLCVHRAADELELELCSFLSEYLSIHTNDLNTMSSASART